VYTILYCHNHNQISGGETSLLELFRTLDRRRFRPILAAPEQGPFPDAVRALDIEVIAVEYSPLHRLDRLCLTALRLQRLARQHGAVLLHASGPVTNIPAALAARLAGLPVVWHARNLIIPGEIDLDHYLAPLASLIIANSDAIRERFRGKHGLTAKSLTIINGVDVARFHPAVASAAVRQQYGFGSQHIVAGIVGRIAPIKGHHIFTEAAAMLLPSCPALRCLIIGAGLFPGEQEYEAQLRAAVAQQGLEDRIIFTGYQRDVRAYTAALDICVVPSDAEPCGRVLFEAMAMAKPVIGTNTGGTPEVVEDGKTGLLIPPCDAKALAAALEHLMGDAELRRRMGAAGRRRVETHFTIEAHARRTEEAYARLLALTSTTSS